MRRFFRQLVIFLPVLIVFAPSVVRADQQADDLYKQYQDAAAHNQVELSVKYLCDAAKLDPQKYGTKCDGAQQFVASRLQKFDGLFVTGRTELDSKDYVGAVRDLSKIDFGPHREEAQKMIAQANDLINHPQPVDNSAQSLKAAQTAYENGDFATATANAGLVKAPDLLSQAQSIQNNIKNYYDDMAQGDALMASKNYQGAQQKYTAAQSIKSNGPGNLSSKLQQLAGLMAAAKQPNAPALAGNKPAAPPDNSAKIKAFLVEAQDAEAKNNLQEAMDACNHVLGIDPKQADALACKTRVQDAMKAALSKDPQALENTLVSGIRSYYDSHFVEARDAISLYLTAGGTRSKGAAYFYLGATMLAQALVSDPKNKNDHDRLQQGAAQQFQQAKQERFKPVEKYVSPKILAVWNQSGM